MAEMNSRHSSAGPRHAWRIAVAVLVCAVAMGLLAWKTLGETAIAASAAAELESESKVRMSPEGDQVKVEVTKPIPHGLGRRATQPGDVHVFESAELYSKVSGYLAEQSVDIGDRVKRGQLLAVIDVPEARAEVEQAASSLELAKSVIVQANARVTSAEAEAKAAEAQIGQMEAEVKRAIAQEKLRTKEYKRIKNLSDLHAIEEQIVDEKQDGMEVAIAAKAAADAAVTNAKAQFAAAQSRVGQAKADVLHAQADVHVAEAKLDKAKVLLEYTKIVSPYDGVVTRRSYHRGDFIIARDQGGTVPLLTVARTDVMRIVVKIPDLDVPFTDVGDKAIVQIDALPGKRLEGSVTRLADAEDPTQKTMRVEIDLPNLQGELHEGMYGLVTITLQSPSDNLTVPAAALVGKLIDGKGKVYVISAGIAHLAPIKVSQDDGLRMEVLSGLKPTDDVVVSYSGAIGDGTPVAASEYRAKAAASH
jgi:RND family efflux transporter MFP subunit